MVVDMGHRDPTFFCTKKNPAPKWYEGGEMMQAAKESWVYVSIASPSGLDRL